MIRNFNVKKENIWIPLKKGPNDCHDFNKYYSKILYSSSTFILVLFYIYIKYRR